MCNHNIKKHGCPIYILHTYIYYRLKGDGTSEFTSTQSWNLTVPVH